MARTKNTAMDRSKAAQATTARKGQFAPRKTILAKKAVARKAISNSEKTTVKRHRHAGSRVHREINILQRKVTTVIPSSCFQRLVRDITCSLPSGGSDIRFQAQAILALQESVENLLSQILRDCQILANHAHRVTIMDKDMEVYMRIVRPQWMLSHTDSAF